MPARLKWMIASSLAPRTSRSRPLELQEFLIDKGVYWDGIDSTLMNGKNRSFVLEDNTEDNSSTPNSPAPNSAFATSHKKRPDLEPTAQHWHHILAYTGPETISHLADNAAGCKVTPGMAPTTIECEDCAVSKPHNIISRRTERDNPATRPFERISYDLIQIGEAYTSDKIDQPYALY